jgi:hypothetical protein
MMMLGKTKQYNERHFIETNVAQYFLQSSNFATMSPCMPVSKFIISY